MKSLDFTNLLCSDSCPALVTATESSYWRPAQAAKAQAHFWAPPVVYVERVVDISVSAASQWTGAHLPTVIQQINCNLNDCWMLSFHKLVP